MCGCTPDRPCRVHALRRAVAEIRAARNEQALSKLPEDTKILVRGERILYGQ